MRLFTVKYAFYDDEGTRYTVNFLKNDLYEDPPLYDCDIYRGRALLDSYIFRKGDPTNKKALAALLKALKKNAGRKYFINRNALGIARTTAS